MRTIRLLLLTVIFSASYTTSSFSQNLEKQLDELLNDQFLPDGPGATALVSIDGEIIYQKAFGMANMELSVAMQNDNVFEIGSVTKQFTAVSILMLMEQGKLKLDDEITKFIPDYPVQGNKISVHHLLNHTSGIKSYTSLESWTAIWRQDYTPLEMIGLFKNEVMDFTPGEAWLYNNSAYFILGYIIEKASGESYEAFIEKNIFKPLEMSSSYYGSMSEIIPLRASGYQKSEKLVNAEYLSLTQPYAAGSIMSTVEDLYKWNEAIKANKLVKQESIDLAFRNYETTDGMKTNYGYGWALSDINGSPTLEHSGGIFGYLSNTIYLPKEHVFVVVLSNCNCNDPVQVSTKMAAVTIGKPYPDVSQKISVASEELEKWTGVYDFEDQTVRQITMEEGQLFSQREGSTKIEIYPVGEDRFIYENSFATITFSEEPNGVYADFGNRNVQVKGVKVDRKPKVREEKMISEEILKKYVGKYTIAPGFDIAISLNAGKLMSQVTGQGIYQVFPESETRFFFKVVDAQLEFLPNKKGDFDSFILYQGGMEIRGTKN